MEWASKVTRVNTYISWIHLLQEANVDNLLIKKPATQGLSASTFCYKSKRIWRFFALMLLWHVRKQAQTDDTRPPPPIGNLGQKPTLLLTELLELTWSEMALYLCAWSERDCMSILFLLSGVKGALSVSFNGRIIKEGKSAPNGIIRRIVCFIFIQFQHPMLINGITKYRILCLFKSIYTQQLH